VVLVILRAANKGPAFDCTAAIIGAVGGRFGGAIVGPVCSPTQGQWSKLTRILHSEQALSYSVCWGAC